MLYSPILPVADGRARSSPIVRQKSGIGFAQTSTFLYFSLFLSTFVYPIDPFRLSIPISSPLVPDKIIRFV